jgi:hypothetical protein
MEKLPGRTARQDLRQDKRVRVRPAASAKLNTANPPTGSKIAAPKSYATRSSAPHSCSTTRTIGSPAAWRNTTTSGSPPGERLQYASLATADSGTVIEQGRGRDALITPAIMLAISLAAGIASLVARAISRLKWHGVLEGCYHCARTQASAMTSVLRLALPRLLLLPAFVCLLCATCRGEGHDVVCSAGFGSFIATSTTGVEVSVGALKSAEFAHRVCQAQLAWNKDTLRVEPSAWQVDVDLMGADLGFGAPVVAVQVKHADVDPLMEYSVYALTKPPRKLRTITGGDFFSAADTDLDGHIEIWTSDAAAVNGFEGLPLSALDFAPPIALRFDHKRLIDVSAEFKPQFDLRIASVRAQLDPEQLSEFKSSDGRLSSMSPLSMAELRGLRATKIRVLEIAWCYLYSGREQDAWKALDDMWPAADVERIRAAILAARAHGIRTQVDGVSDGSASGRRKRAMIFDRVTGESARSTEVRGLSGAQVNESGGDDDKMRAFEADTFPRAILMRRPAPPEGADASFLSTEVVVNMVVDSAGKVWSIKTEGKPNKDLIDASTDWKFMPALKDGRPVASRLRMGVTPYQ